MPYGCFEQTSSTTYPNVLALDYLRQTGKSVPEVEAKARQYIHLGYQRLVSFEVPGGGFDWFGRPPANRILTAYGLMEFEDMARVHDVDPQLIERTRAWLLGQRKPDGSWASEAHKLARRPAGQTEAADLDYGATAYMAWAVFGNGQASGAAAADTRLLAGPLNGFDRRSVPVGRHGQRHRGDRSRESRGSAAISIARSPQTDQPGWQTRLVGTGVRCPHELLRCGPRGHIETTAMATLALLSTGQSSGDSQCRT